MDFSPRKGMSDADIAQTVEAILSEQSLEEKVAMMSGRGFFQAMIEDRMRWSMRPYQAGGGCERLNVPALYFTDGPRGVARGSSTCFPVSIARGASWDRDLEYRVGEAMGVEVRAQGCNLSGAVCVNLLRHPGWGRAQETYGEDSFHVGEMGAALSQGIQSQNVIATVKHLALNSLENTRFTVDVRVDERTMREVYLPHFKRVIDAGCASVMSAYNKVNGEYCGQHDELLTQILRNEWKFEGFVHSDWIMGVYHPYGASAGLDIENPEPVQFGDKLIKAVEAGQIDPFVIDRACRRILRTLYRFLSAEDPYEAYPASMVCQRSHTDLALEAAEKSAVLLTNNGILPLKRNTKIGVFGRLAARANIGDNGSSRVRPPYVVTPLEGLSKYLDQELELTGEESDLPSAMEQARMVDTAIVVVGTTADDEGEFIPANLGGTDAIPEHIVEALTAARESIENELDEDDAGAMGGNADRGGDRELLRLPAEQVELIKAVSSVNPNTVVVIVSGSAIISWEWVGTTAAVLQTFYAGMEGGTALANLLFGELSPSGKLPFVVAASEEDYPHFDKTAKSIEYGPLHGYTLLQANQTEPQFHFGHGLSYSNFEYRGLKVRKTVQGVEAEITVVNTGGYDADEIVQIYVGFPNTTVARQGMRLKGFVRQSIKAGELKTLKIEIREQDLKFWDCETRAWRLEPGRHTISVGGSSDQRTLVSEEIAL